MQSFIQTFCQSSLDGQFSLVEYSFPFFSLPLWNTVFPFFPSLVEYSFPFFSLPCGIQFSLVEYTFECRMSAVQLSHNMSE